MFLLIFLYMYKSVVVESWAIRLGRIVQHSPPQDYLYHSRLNI